MNIFKTIAKRIATGFEASGKNRVRQQLLTMSDHQLSDIGYSRDLVRRGVDYWPWRLETATLSQEAELYTANADITQTSANEKAAA